MNAAVCQNDPCRRSLFQKQPLYLAFQMDANSVFFHLTLQCPDHIGRMIGTRKNAVSPLCFKRRACFLQKFHHILTGKGIKGTV